MSKQKKKLPAIPPNDYRGSVAAWMRGLMERALWDGKRPEFHGDVWLTVEQYHELLDACEARRTPTTGESGNPERKGTR